MSGKNNVLNHFQDVIQENWDCPFILDHEGDRSLLYSDVFKRAISLVDWFNQHPTIGGEIPFAPHERTTAVTVYIAGLLSDRTVYALDSGRGNQEVDTIVQKTPSNVILSNSPSLAGRDDVLELPDVSETGSSLSSVLEHIENIDPKEPYLITFTSGTTGDPKGVMHSFENLVEASLEFGEQFDFNSDNVFQNTFSIAYMAGILNGLFLPMMHGSRVSITPKMGPTTAPSLLDQAAELDVDVFWFSPTMIHMLLKLGSSPYRGPDHAIGCVATEALPEALREEFEEKFGIRLYESYGLSETLFITTEHPQQSDRDDGVGQPLKSAELSIEDDNEINVNVPWMFLGYLNKEKSSGREDGFRTGDLGEFTNDSLTFIDRKENIIVRNGVNIAPDSIEEVVKKNFHVEDLTVTKASLEDVSEQVVCLFVSRENSIDQNKIQRSIIRELGTDYRVDKFIEVDSIPRGNDGTVDPEFVRSSV